MGAESNTNQRSTQGVRAVLVAAGKATRMGNAEGPRKPMLMLAGKTILEHACAAFGRCNEVTSIVIVTREESLAEVRALCANNATMTKVCAVVPGGANRGDSVRLGIQAELPDPMQSERAFDLIAVHDAARPLVRSEAIGRAIQSARAHGAALLSMAVRDTLKRSEDGQRVMATVDRSQLWIAQTPQVFEANQLRDCHRRAHEEDFLGTDDASLWERYIGPLRLVPGHWDNLKITEPADLKIAEALLTSDPQAPPLP